MAPPTINEASYSKPASKRPPEQAAGLVGDAWNASRAHASPGKGLLVDSPEASRRENPPTVADG